MNLPNSTNDNTKYKIVTEALRLFKEKGYDNVTVKDICDTCDLTRGAFYYYYKTKADILDDMFIQSDLLSTEQLVSILKSENYLEQFLAIFDIYLDGCLELGPDIYGNMYIHHIEKGTALSDPDTLTMKPVYTMLLEKAQTANQIKNSSPASDLYKAIVEITSGIAVLWCSYRGSFDLKKRILKSFRVLLDPTEPYISLFQ